MGDYQRHAYHSGRQGWTRNPRSLVGDHVGIELELDVSAHGASYHRLLDALPNPQGKTAATLRPIAETDGSLDYSGGVEIIFPPLSVSRVIGKKTFFRRAVTSMEKEFPRYLAPGNAGMHVNVNVRGWDSELIDLMILAFNHFSQELVTAIGGRQLSGWCAQLPGQAFGITKDGTWGYLGEPGQTAVILGAVHGNHHTIVNRTASRLEFRYPASTLNMDQITRNIAFVYYVRDFLKMSMSKHRLQVQSTLTATFGTKEEFEEKIIKYIRTRRKSKKRDLVMEVINARTNRSKAPRSAVQRSTNA